MIWVRHPLVAHTPYHDHRSSRVARATDRCIYGKSDIHSTCIHIFSSQISMKYSGQINTRAFTLFEIMISMTIFALLMIIVFDAVANIGIARTRSITRITLLEELYFFSEKLATSIKEWGIVDYEEYWNRQVVGTGTATGHYLLPTGYGNYGRWGMTWTTTYGSEYYYCRSGGNILLKVGTGGCMSGNNSNANWWSPDINYSGNLQRYGQYALQYTDYNGNYDADLWNEDSDTLGNIRWDEDDKDIGDGPIVLSGSTPELYLYDPLKKERTYFRWTYKPDDIASPTACDMNTGIGCLGNIEMLRLKGLDIGMAHTGTANGTGSFDWVIDTWACHPDWPCTTPALKLPVSVWVYTLPAGTDSEWVKLFPDYVSVRQLSFTIYPRKNPWRSWAAPDDLSTPGFISPFIQPYVRLQMTLGLAWEKRKLIRWDDPTVAISTTISLTSINPE